MNTVLLVITLISAVTAIAAIASARRARRSEQERSQARVAALAHAADTHGAADGGWTSVAGEWQWTAEPQRNSSVRNTAAALPRDERVVQSHDTMLHRDAPTAVTGDRFFGTVERDEPSGNRLPLLAAAALILTLGGALFFLNTTRTDGQALSAHARRAEPLELVSLGHARETTQLTIRGTVRNPVKGVKVEGLTAVISLLGPGGALISTKDVPLDYRALGPGEEAPFKVTIPDPGSIARYRVSFRTGTDVVPHVDRRTDSKLASALQ
ncbi:MAG TPA: hypothetical protein VM032_01125 [Vicinamibacterales bacterium]|nr:hypothetical protein [Vicinamibacterales bacterium]